MANLRLISFYVITYTCDEKEKRTERTGIQEAYRTAMKKVKQLKDDGAILEREGTRGVGRVWVGKLGDKNVRLSISLEKRPDSG